ncbi:MAG: ribonuclease T2 [Sphingomonadales bacterium]|nr:ribonuclease T2 [Sphingomonadales bacterium]
MRRARIAIMLAVVLGPVPAVAGPHPDHAFGQRDFRQRDFRAGAPRDLGPRAPGAFDYYVLALTWVPGFCATHDDPQECSRPVGFGLHGLWPQLNGGDWPSNCARGGLSPADRMAWRGIYPSGGMIDHEWAKHGTCSGMAPADYFRTSRAALGKVAIPADYRVARRVPKEERGRLIGDFVRANPGMTAAGIRVNAQNGVIVEVQICMTRNGAFRDC